jgi:hypothetical protein
MLRPNVRGIAALLLFLLTGCATPCKVNTDIWHSLTPEQRGEADVLETVLAKLGARCLAENPGQPCTPPKVLLTWAGTQPQYARVTHTILIPAWALKSETRPTMAHEIGHAWWADARDDCGTPEKLILCEYNANHHAIFVLMVGYGYDERTAIRMRWSVLVWSVASAVKPSPGHPDACAELHAFERRLGIREYACTERVSKR